MDNQKITDTTKLVREFVSKHLKMIFSLVLIFIVLLFGWNWYNSQPKSIVSDLNPTFSGYDGYGTLDYNYEDIQKKVWEYSLKSVGMNSEEIQGVINKDEIVLSEINADSNKASKLQQATTIVGTVNYDFNKVSDLKNGESVIFTVKNSSTKSPIKSETKKFKVKGLEKTEKISLSKMLESNPIETLGFEGYGYLNFPNDSDENPIYLLKDENLDEYGTNFKNGEKVPLVISDSYIEKLKSEGKKLENESFDYEIKGLKPLVDIKGTENVLPKNDDRIKSSHENTSFSSYKIEKQKSYISFVPAYNDENLKGTVNIVTVYKITETSKYSDPEIIYSCIGYNYNVDNNEQVASENNYDVSVGQTEDEENLIATLKTENYIELK